ncbi:MAG: F0F1 ATP synthase subunit C, partial [Campylobacter sp.]|nr:F0F1 ATP synthase subunit C [Campylobacter sp.]
MKKIIFLTLAFASFAFGAEGDATATIQAFSVLAAGVGLGIAA